MKTNETKVVKAYFKRKLASDPAWAVKGMMKIYSFQTASEQARQETHELNRVGFSGCDAEILSSFCDQVNRGWRLSQKQMFLVFKKMPRYWKQLWNAVEPNKAPAVVESAMKFLAQYQ
jgi:hypothetical protein